MHVSVRFINKWIMALLLVTFVAGCENNHHLSIQPAKVTDSKAITAYSLNGASGTIDESARTISVTMPTGTKLTALTATYTTTGKFVAVGSSQQISACTPNDFTVPLVYRVTATDSSTRTYSVTAIVYKTEVGALTSSSLQGGGGSSDAAVKASAVTLVARARTEPPR